MSLFSDKFFKSNETTFPLSDTIALPSHQNIGWTQHRADALIGLVAMAWGSSYLLMKVGLGTIPPFSLIALRFLIAFFAVSLLFREKIKQTTPRTLLRGSILGRKRIRGILLIVRHSGLLRRLIGLIVHVCHCLPYCWCPLSIPHEHAVCNRGRGVQF